MLRRHKSAARTAIHIAAAAFMLIASRSTAETGTASGSASARAARSSEPIAAPMGQLRLLVGSNPGGGYDTYARLLAAHLPARLPGTPKIIVQNMPGAGSLVVTNYLVNVAPRDGTVFAAVHSLAATHPLFYPERAKYDARTLVWIGSAVRETTFGLTSASSKVQSLKDLFNKDPIVAGSTGSTTSFPAFMNSVLGTRFNIVKGYNATSAALLALERGEVDGVIGVTGPGLTGLGERLVEQGQAHLFIQFGMKRHPNHMNTDWIFDYAERPEQRTAMKLMFGTQEFGRPFVAPPGIPNSIASKMRSAFASVLKDDALLQEAGTRRLEIDYTSPEEISEIIASMYEASPATVEFVKQFLGDQGQ